MSDLPPNVPRFKFVTSAYGAKLEVLRFQGVEEISRLFEFQIELVSEKSDLDFDKLVGKTAGMMITGRREKRFFHGIISRMEVLSVLARRTIYRAHFVAPHFKLTLNRNIRTFNNKTTEQIVTEVLKDRGYTKLTWTLKETYKPRDFCVQYRETDLDFVSRLLEEEGIAYHFVNTSSELKMVFTDKNASLPSIPREAAVVFNDNLGQIPPQEFVNSLTFQEQLRMGKAELRDYDFKNVKHLKSAAEGANKGLELYEFPGEFVESSLGDRLARVRLEELELEGKTGAGSSDCSRFGAGYTFTLGGAGGKHPRAKLNQKYLLTRVIHNGLQRMVLGEEGGGGEASRYGNAFSVIPASVTFRPPRITPRPEIHGIHSAIVVGVSPKEEVYTDKYGRVKVWFQWDRVGKGDEKSSCYVRVSNSWAGGQYGSMFMPRIGQEVLVDFLEGDPDRPAVVGRVYNGKQDMPQKIPGDKTRSTIRTHSSPNAKGINELTFEDKAGQEHIKILAQKNYVMLVNRNATLSTGNNWSESIKNNRSLKVGNVEKLDPADPSMVPKGTLKVEVKKEMSCSAKKIDIKADVKMSLKVGSSTITLLPGIITIDSPKIDSKAAAMNKITGGLVTINPTTGAAATAFQARLLKIAKDNLKAKLAAALQGRSPTLMAQIAKLEADGWTIRETLPGEGKGSWCNKKEKVIVVAKNKSGPAIIATVAHEVGHANYTQAPYVPPAGLTKKQYVDVNRQSSLDDEGAAVINENKISDEVKANGGPDTRSNNVGKKKYTKIYKKYKKGQIDEPTARRQIGEKLGKLETTSTTGEKYDDYYGKAYDKHFDKHGMAQGGKADPPPKPWWKLW